MLAHFQQALADLVASPERCRALQEGADLESVIGGYDLSPRERARLLAIVAHDGMEANCTVYRSNRLTPLALNLPATCRALGSHLRAVLDRFWSEHPTENFVHFLVESDRFVRFPAALDLAGLAPDDEQRVRDELRREGEIVRSRLAATLAVGLSGQSPSSAV